MPRRRAGREYNTPRSSGRTCTPGAMSAFKADMPRPRRYTPSAALGYNRRGSIGEEDTLASDLRIRGAQTHDVDTIAAFNVALARESEHKALDPAVAREGVRLMIADDRLGRYFLAELNGHVIGQCMVTCEWSDWRAGLFWWLQSVYVHPDHRGRGVFQRLYEHVAAEARRTPRVCGIRLYVERENARAIRAYEKLGLRPSGHVVYEHDWSAALT